MSTSKPVPPELLVGRRGLALLLCAMAIVAGVLFQRSQQRQHDAEAAPLSALSLSYLRQAVRDAPADRELALKLVSRLFEAGQETEAQQLLAPLVGQAGPVGQQARLLGAEQLAARVFAIPATLAEARNAARRGASRDLSALSSGAENSTLLRLAELAEQLDLSQLRAAFLERVVRAELSTDQRGTVFADHVHQADEAFLAEESPEGAGILLTDVAAELGSPAGEPYALLAVARLRQAENAKVAYGRYQRQLAGPFAGSLRIQHSALSLASAVDPETAYAHAQEMVRHPQSGQAEQRALLQWAVWTGQRGTAIATLRDLCQVGCGYQDRRLLRSLAEVNRPRLRITAEGLERRYATAPGDRATLLALLAMREAEGDFTGATALVYAARRRAPRDSALLRVELGLRLRLGDEERAMVLLSELHDNGLATRIELEQLADFMMSRGQLVSALKVLREGALASDDEDRLRQLVEYALEIDALDTARLASRRLLAARKAGGADMRILAALELEAGRPMQAGEAMMIAFERFGEPAMLEEALSLYAATGDGRALLGAVVRAEAHTLLAAKIGVGTRVKARAEAHHLLAKQAVDASDYKTAQRQLNLAKAALTRPADEVGPVADDLAELRRSNRRLSLSLALDAGDQDTVAEVYPSLSAELSAPERVHVLRRLGRDSEAFALSLGTLRSGASLSTQDETALDAVVQGLRQPRRRTVNARAHSLELADLRAQGVGAGVELGFEDFSITAEADYQRMTSKTGASLAFPAEQLLRASATASFLGAPFSPHAVVGIDARQEFTSLPILGLGAEVTDSESLRVTFDALLNEPANDTAQLRVLGAKDSGAARAVVALSRHLYSQASARVDAFRARQGRRLLGWGATLEAGLGAQGEVGAIAARWNARLLGRFAPRFALDGDRDLQLTPDGSTFVGVGAGIFRGDLDMPPLWGRRLSLLVDGSVGYLVPQQVVGFSARAGVGLPIFTADQIVLSAQADNTVGANAGQTAVAVTINYAFSFLR